MRAERHPARRQNRDTTANLTEALDLIAGLATILPSAPPTQQPLLLADSCAVAHRRAARAYALASRVTDDARAVTGDLGRDSALASYGALCMVSALIASVTGRTDESDARFAEL
jgi:hypothetical protein